MLFCALFTLLQALNTIVHENYNLSKHFKVHTNEDKTIISFPDAIDANLILYSQEGSCHLQSKNILLLNQNIQMIDDHQFQAQEFLDGTPFQFREFMCMTQIKDGIIALTTDLILYLFLFDYEAIYSMNNNNFAKIHLKANLKTLLGDEEKYDISQIIQLVYLEQTESALVIFNNLAYLFSVNQLKQINNDVLFIKIEDWITRNERGLTQYFDGFVFSSIGQYGLDIYKEEKSSLLFISYLNQQRLDLDDFNLKDFSVFRLPDLKFRLFCLLDEGDVLVIDIRLQDYEMTFETVLKISSKGSGIAIDTKNGQNVFVVYQKSHIYEVNELWIPLESNPRYIILDSFTTKSLIKDVDAIDEFAILQGQSHHKVLFSDRQFQQNSNYSNLPTFIQYGMRDFEFIKLTPESVYIDEENEYEPDDFFFGITSNKIVLAQFKVHPIQIKCFAEKNQQNQYYQLIYNTSNMIEIQEQFYEKITQNVFNFTVEYTTTYIFQTELLRLEILFSGLFLFSILLILFWIFLKRNTIKILESQLEKIQRIQNQYQAQCKAPNTEIRNLTQED